MPETITSQGPKSVSEILNAAADLLEKPGAWTQHEFARDAVGRAVNYESYLAMCWCARGAIGAVNEDPDHRAAHRLWSETATVLGFESIEDIEGWNDAPGRTQAEVVAALRAAASKSESPNV